MEENKLTTVTLKKELLARVHAKYNAENIDKNGESVSKPKAAIAILEKFLQTKK